MNRLLSYCHYLTGNKGLNDDVAVNIDTLKEKVDIKKIILQPIAEITKPNYPNVLDSLNDVVIDIPVIRQNDMFVRTNHDEYDVNSQIQLIRSKLEPENKLISIDHQMNDFEYFEMENKPNLRINRKKGKSITSENFSSDGSSQNISLEYILSEADS